MAMMALAVTALAVACDDHSEAKSTAPAKETPSATPSAAAPPPPPPPSPPPLPTLTASDHGLTVDGQEQPWEKLEDRVAPLGARKADVENKDIALVAMRNAPAHRVAQAASLLLAAWHPRTLTIRSPTRDQSQGEVVLTYRGDAHAADCSAVAMIEKDSGVAVWAKGGGGAQRFARGMAGPDLTASTEALRKRFASCDSPVWFVAAADSVTWGLVFDLTQRAKSDADGAAPAKPHWAVLLPHAPVAGRPVKGE
jgi:hypothetical protein